MIADTRHDASQTGRGRMARHGLAGSSTWLATLALSVAVGGSAVNASGPLTIIEVLAEFDPDGLMITGESLDRGPGPLVVTLGDPLGVAGDITSACTLVTPELITCDLSAGGLPPAGDYLLVVSNGRRSSQTDEYDLTIGAVGPQGPPGIDGITQTTRVQGQLVNCGSLCFAFARCPEAGVLTGGGCHHFENAVPPPVALLSSWPFSADRWACSYGRINGGAAQVQAWAMCAMPPAP